MERSSTRVSTLTTRSSFTPHSPTFSRASTIFHRPIQPPVGPRLRHRASNINTDYSKDSPVSPREDHFLKSSLDSEGQEPLSAPAYDDHLLPPSRRSSHRPHAVRPVTQLPKLVPAPVIKFESSPVAWKGLPLEAALWTLDSRELQSIVSRAIRSSAQESYIRLLTLENLDTVLPSELERLGLLKDMTQSKYRFLVHRRTMLLQALHSSSSVANNGGEDTMGVINKLTVQLSETTGECDRLLEELIKITDHVTQITKLLDRHWASALAIALRKLNASYGRRTTELAKTKERIVHLEAELEDAWTEAEKMAQEMDEYDTALISDMGEAVIETAEKISLPRSPTSHDIRADVAPQTPKILSVEPSLRSPSSPTSPLPPKFSRDSRDHDAAVDVPDSVSIRSVQSNRSEKSTRSHRSTRSLRGDGSRASQISAAKIRSHRASQGSLRLPPVLHRKAGPSGSEDQPPVPSLPLQFTSFSSNLTSANIGTSPLDEPGMAKLVPVRRRTSLESIHVVLPPTTSHTHNHRMLTTRTVTVDDIYVRHRRNPPSINNDDDEIQVVPRTPPTRSLSLNKTLPSLPRRKSSLTYLARRKSSTKQSGQHIPGQNIPSIWMNIDAPKTPAERVEGLMRGDSTSGKGSNKTYQRLRTLTKRYSLPFPIFAPSNSGKSDRT